jgi:hypothetical protein
MLPSLTTGWIGAAVLHVNRIAKGGIDQLTTKIKIGPTPESTNESAHFEFPLILGTTYVHRN